MGSRSAGRRCPAGLLLAAGQGGGARRTRMGCSGETAWLSSYLPLAWAGHVCLGLALGILGPTQPFLATQVGVPNKQINFIWTGRALGTCIAAVVTSFVFRLYFKKTWQKLTLLALGLIGIGFFILLIPWISSFALLLSS